MDLKLTKLDAFNLKGKKKNLYVTNSRLLKGMLVLNLEPI